MLERWRTIGCLSGRKLKVSAASTIKSPNLRAAAGLCAAMASYDAFKVLQETVPEDYFEVHWFKRARTSVAEYLCWGLAAAAAIASSKAARS